jgi:CIC family chloride channel protein
MRFWMVVRLRPADWCIPILLAVPAGVLGALATILFRELIDYFQSIVFGERGDLGKVCINRLRGSCRI